MLIGYTGKSHNKPTTEISRFVSFPTTQILLYREQPHHARDAGYSESTAPLAVDIPTGNPILDTCHSLQHTHPSSSIIHKNNK
jgi:hypothetical protein